MNGHNAVVVDIHIAEDDFLRLYQGRVNQVSAVARDGRRIRFPAGILVPFVTHQGIHGTFELRFDSNHKFSGIHQLA